eukprot:403340568
MQQQQYNQFLNQQQFNYGGATNQAANQKIKAQNDQQSLEDQVQGEVRERTHLIQLYSDHPDEGPRLISQYHPQGTPIIVLIDAPSSCYCKLNLPHGIVSLEQKWGKSTGMMTPGWHCCYCSHKRVAAMITKNTIQFNTPVKSCPTKDNVRVTVDVSIYFHIGKDETREQDCQMFMYYLGANKLEELLIQECEENVRNYMRKVKVNQVRDLKSEVTMELVSDLNLRFNKYGVYVESSTIPNVIIPKDLRIALQQATTYDVFLQNQVKIQENLRLKMQNEENKTLLILKRENQKKLLELNNQLVMEEIYLQKFKVQCETEQQQKIIQANQIQSIKIIQAQAIKEQAEKRAKKQAEQMIAEALAYSEAKKIEATAKGINMASSAKARYEYARIRQVGVGAEADAEGQQSQNLQNKRQHEEKMSSISNMAKMMRENNIVIGGKTADELLSYFKDTQDIIEKNI